MYWPIGAPNVYALSKHAFPGTIVTQSEDGLDDNDDVSASPIQPEDDGQDDTAELKANGTKASEHSVKNGKTKQMSAREVVNAKRGEHEILDIKISRGGSIFVTITRSSLTVWQTKPTVALATVTRSLLSMQTYGPNTALLLRPDALIIVLQASLGYLITYSLATDPSARVYQTVLPESSRHARKASTDGYSNLRKPSVAASGFAPAEGDGLREVNVRFRMVIRIDAGISRAIALDDELIVATQQPAALQCIKWVADNGSSQTSTELVSRIPWVGRKACVMEMLHDRPMSLSTWITDDGRAFVVQRRSEAKADPENPKALFQGFCFREPETDEAAAKKVAINARFSLIAIGCANGQIDAYVVKDYFGNVPLSHKIDLHIASTTTGQLTCLAWSPDGYCLFAGYEHGWATWTVYGKLCASSFSADQAQLQATDEQWLRGIQGALWLGGGCELALLPRADNRIWTLDMARNSTAGCFTPANISRGLLHSSDSVMVYKGHDVADVTSLPSDMPMWQTVQIPAHYLVHQWPIKAAVVSPDGKYIAVAGRRGLAHYSVSSGRWRTFDDTQLEQEFAVRGGMCWHHHVLIASVEASNRYEIRLYSREKSLDFNNIQHTEKLPAPAISTTMSGTDSLLVYTYDNTLLHYIVVMTASASKLVQVGQIGFHGIIRAPLRVRSISWILPEDQLEHGDPSQDVATAAVLFLVDGKLVLLQPSTNEQGELKYDMRVIAQNVEYYTLLRDHPAIASSLQNEDPSTPDINGLSISGHLGHSLRDSLWYFDGSGFNVWSDIHDVLASAPSELGRDLPPVVTVPLDFAPLSTVVGKGIILGVEADLVQRRDVNFSYFRHAPRTQLFLPQLLRHHLTEYNSPAALHLSSSYEHLPYFSHALEVTLHDVLDAEVDNPPSPPETALLPTVLSFLSSFDSYLDVVVNCTRKTELRSWQTLFSYLPPVLELFEQSLAQNKLNTAAGYLLVLHAFEQDLFQIHEFAQLLRLAAYEQDWELCKELSRFLVGIDGSGGILRSTIAAAGFKGTPNGDSEHAGDIRHPSAVTGLNGRIASPRSRAPNNRASQGNDYFSLSERITYDQGEESYFATPEDRD
ncbi:DUF1339 domain protein [Zymoseptoria brevis]|uniref:DUF1339 domain protein n=1 Tax=Zymoseptoria brevis TaxID=1047168 RepID=A0A0F4GBL0_9PEZI|nr:DUF1339 domain protein [Zymoseptoria brevis]